MKKVYSADLLNLLPFIYSYSSKKCSIITDYDGITLFKFDDIEFIHDITNIPQSIYNGSSFNLTHFNPGDVIIENVHNIWGINSHFGELDIRLTQVLELCDLGIDVLILDIVGDNHSIYNTTLDINKFLNLFKTIPNLYFLTAREFFGDYQNKIKTNLSYLNLSHYYFYLSDSFFAFPYPDYSHILHTPSYDFISYLGLTSDIIDSKPYRMNTLSKIDFKNKTIYTPNTFVDTHIENTVLNLKGINHGHFNWFNFLECRTAKIKIVFESFSTETHIDSMVNCLTEKTFKCFIDIQPYFLIINTSQKKRLRELGFKFPDPDDEKSQIDYISNLCMSDVDTWVIENNHIFIHNNKLFKKYLYGEMGDHIKFLKSIK